MTRRGWSPRTAGRAVTIMYVASKNHYSVLTKTGQITFWLRQELKKSQCACVRLFGPNLSRALNLHLSFLGQPQVSPRSVSDQSQVPGHSQVSLR